VPLATLPRPARDRGSGNNGVAGTALHRGKPAIAMSSSVVVVNITRSRRRTTNRGTDHLLILPAALAAFVAGLTISEGPVSAEARRRLLPFRDLFAIFFFVAIGTLIDPSALSRGLGWLVVSLALVAIAKSAVIFGLARISRLPAHAGQLSVGLGQVGEF
jgi:predicted Kef-type K+ transport protein